jgi:ligand-binding SRPBCC domain-containing protein
MSIEISRFQNEFRLSAELVLPKKLEEIFSFFSCAKNLEKITPDFLNFKIVSNGALEMSVGTIIDYKLRVHGIPLRWKSLISVWDPPHVFVDEQLRGPYRYWIHRHMFEEHEEGTRVMDLVRYQVLGGSIIHDLFVRRDLLKIFTCRQETLLKEFT